MTFAIIQTGGKQYKVQTGDTLKVEKLEVGENKAVSFEALLVDDGKTTKLGKEAAGSTVAAEVIGGGKGDKVIVIHYKPKVRHFKKRGHRQLFSEIKIGEIK
jgi:large subunit ribosomal protein L21